MTKEILISSLNLNLDNQADTVERLFCAAITHAGSDAALTILKAYNEWKKILGIVPQLPTTSQSTPLCGKCDKKESKYHYCEKCRSEIGR